MATITVDDYRPHAKQVDFHKDASRFRLLLGAWRSGKTHALLWEAIYMAIRTAERSGAGAIFALFRKTGPALSDTLVKDFDLLCPPALVKSRINTLGRIERELQGGTRLLFRSMDDWRKLGGQSFDAEFLDEAWEFDRIDLDMLRGRLSGPHGPRRLVLATNPPTRANWLYQVFVEKPLGNSRVHHFSTYDNRAHLAADYIAELETLDESRKRRFLFGEWGFTSDREPVFPEFRESSHVADLRVQPVRDAFLLVGWDFGFRMPAVVFSQVLPTGHVNVLREVTANNIDIRVFAKQVKQRAELHFPGLPLIHYCDVAGVQHNDLGTTSVAELRKEGIHPRFRKLQVLQTVQQLRELICTTHLGLPLLRCDRTGCPLLIEALVGGYGMTPMQPGRDEKEEPFKDGTYDHVVDALRYSVAPAVFMSGGGLRPLPAPSRRARVSV